MKSNKPAFDLQATYVARKGFRFHGRTYDRGAEFPWRRISCSGRKLFQLYDNGFLTLASASCEEAESQEEQPSASERRRLAAQKAAETRKRNEAARAAQADLADGDPTS